MTISQYGHVGLISTDQELKEHPRNVTLDKEAMKFLDGIVDAVINIQDGRVCVEDMFYELTKTSTKSAKIVMILTSHSVQHPLSGIQIGGFGHDQGKRYGSLMEAWKEGIKAEPDRNNFILSSDIETRDLYVESLPQ